MQDYTKLRDAPSLFACQTSSRPAVSLIHPVEPIWISLYNSELAFGFILILTYNFSLT